MYNLYFWNPWGFGKWIPMARKKYLREIRALVKGKVSVTYMVTDGHDISYHIARSCYWRPGMVRPKLPGNYARFK